MDVNVWACGTQDVGSEVEQPLFHLMEHLAAAVHVLYGRRA